MEVQGFYTTRRVQNIVKKLAKSPKMPCMSVQFLQMKQYYQTRIAKSMSSACGGECCGGGCTSLGSAGACAGVFSGSVSRIPAAVA